MTWSARGGATDELAHDSGDMEHVVDLEAADEMEDLEILGQRRARKLEPLEHLSGRMGASDSVWTAVHTCGDGACALHSVQGAATNVPGLGNVLFQADAREQLLADMPESLEGFAAERAVQLAM